MNQEIVISEILENVLSICNPIKILLISKKYDASGQLSSFKLCVIVEDSVDLDEIESQIYLELDCENPFDVILYTLSEWEEICEENGSFANKIQKSGVLLYEK